MLKKYINQHYVGLLNKGNNRRQPTMEQTACVLISPAFRRQSAAAIETLTHWPGAWTPFFQNSMILYKMKIKQMKQTPQQYYYSLRASVWRTCVKNIKTLYQIKHI